jgi:hypothetical protein
MDDLESLYDQLDAYAGVIRNRDARIADLLMQLEQKELARYTLAVGYESASQRAADLEAQIAAANAQGPAGVVGYMPGAAGFTMATFLATDVPPGTKVFTTPQPTPSAIEAWSALIANSLLGQQKKEDVEEVERLIYELLGVKT